MSPPAVRPEQRRGASDDPRPPVPVPQLPQHLQGYARAIDDGWGNRDGTLQASELDAFARMYGSRSEHRQPIETLRGLLAPAPVPLSTVTAASLAAARRLVRAGGSGDASDVQALVAEVARLPVQLLEKVDRAGIKFIACRNSVTDHLRSLRGVAPRGWPPGVTWDTVPGNYWPNEKQVVIGTRTGSTGQREVPPRGAGHGSLSLVAHELLHGLDYRRGLGAWHSRDTAFLNSWSADRHNLDAYLAQNPPAGPEEAFAELASRAMLGDTQLAAKAPNLTAYFERMKREMGIT